jgi:hypothetical protein
MKRPTSRYRIIEPRGRQWFWEVQHRQGRGPWFHYRDAKNEAHAKELIAEAEAADKAYWDRREKA